MKKLLAILFVMLLIGFFSICSAQQTTLPTTNKAPAKYPNMFMQITSINKKAGTLTVKKANGDTKTFTVNHGKTRTLKVGDMVFVTYKKTDSGELKVYKIHKISGKYSKSFNSTTQMQ